MNIFFLDKNVKKCAQYHVNTHVIKMRVELAQLLCTAHRILDGQQILIKGYSFNEFNKTYSKPKTIGVLEFENIIDGILYNQIYLQTHINHPSAIWARESLENYQYIINLAIALSDELKFRFNTKEQKIIPILSWLLKNPPKNLKSKGLTTPLLAMDDLYKVNDNMTLEDSILNYRNYYNQGKTHLFKWTNRQKPSFITS
jgi:hypothetical protein